MSLGPDYDLCVQGERGSIRQAGALMPPPQRNPQCHLTHVGICCQRIDKASNITPATKEKKKVKHTFPSQKARAGCGQKRAFLRDVILQPGRIHALPSCDCIAHRLYRLLDATLQAKHIFVILITYSTDGI